MHIVTGGAGFLGSAIVWMLNRRGVEDILVVDNLARTEKWRNLVGLRISGYMPKDEFLALVESNRAPADVQAVIHMGACSSTTETDANYLMSNNVVYSQVLCRYALEQNARFVYASSAATYGDGSRGFDDEADIGLLRPLNMYGYSKHLFDLWVRRLGLEDRVAGLKFFNVFGPNEWHKGEMRSVVCKAHEQISAGLGLKLFRSHRPDCGHGEQQRDFVYVKDCTELIWWLLEHPESCGLFNVGTGQARTFKDLGLAVFRAMDREADISYMDMPESLRDKYQYFTQATMDKLRRAGFDRPFTPMEEAVEDYVRRHLALGGQPLDVEVDR
ncbi:MAG: ADP-glyceromanno-heptose 6-epimerase [Deltaproteobacteria bacterium]|nr:ADP-glyceromanno-heptose 6-epimerase [Deltaproteobacteria bacterium]